MFGSSFVGEEQAHNKLRLCSVWATSTRVVPSGLAMAEKEQQTVLLSERAGTFWVRGGTEGEWQERRCRMSLVSYKSCRLPNKIEMAAGVLYFMC